MSMPLAAIVKNFQSVLYTNKSVCTYQFYLCLLVTELHLELNLHVRRADAYLGDITLTFLVLCRHVS